ncbi:alpha-2-macroglobulin-like protein [Plakobranchus ocellatus]|uniref:Alpha-2-macroglobulin-like protein n=1 Tax=Plakobranchus ocellatus TaxID=259542 RepID=A0AAV3YMK9_9GAST|nr:alpha-2-macroglobulin-like protein [Plakobranchus ocellatus]
MAPRKLVIVRVFILALGLCGAYARSGYLLTLPLVLRSDTTSQFCMILYEDTPGQRNVTLTFTEIITGEKWVILMYSLTIGLLRCEEFPVPPPGIHEVILRNSTDILHDPFKVTVLDNKITLIQTDKAMYRFGETVRIRIITMFTTMMPRTGQSNTVSTTRLHGHSQIHGCERPEMKIPAKPKPISSGTHSSGNLL